MPGKGRVDSLDIFRGLMALSVAVYHFAYWYPVFQPGHFAAYTAKKIGAYGVETFFIISGFCFFYLYGAETLTWKGLKQFHRKRWFRIAPLYYAAVAVNVLCGFNAGPGHTPRMLLENVSFTFGFIHPNHALVIGGWSIGLEYLFYFAFPLLAWAAARWKPFLAVATVVLLGASIPWSFAWVPAAPFAGDMKFHTYVHVANHACLFTMGGLIAQARLGWNRRLSTAAFLALCALLGAAFCMKYRNFYDDFVIMAGAARYYFILVCFAATAVFAFYDFPDGPVKTVGKWLGEVSYSVYLLHPLVQEGLRRILPEAVNPWPGFLLGLAATLGLGTLTFRWLERPLMAFGRRG